jgi:hypothetical protein
MKTRLTAACAAALIMLPACSGSKPVTEASFSTPSSLGASTTTRPTAPSTTTAGPNQQLLAAVRGFWDLYLELGARTGPFNTSATRTRLRQRTSGRELNKLYDFLHGNAVAGYSVKGTIDFAPNIVSIARTTALVRDCYDDKTGLFRVGDGKRIDTKDPLRHKVLMTFKRGGGVWKVSAIKGEGLGCTV